jgi:hypothetical protein
MEMSNSKDKEKQPESPPKNVTPIHDGKVQPDTTLEKAIIDLGNTHPNTWSIIHHDK